MSYTQRVTSSASRTQIRRQLAVPTSGEPGKKISGGISKEEARHQQELKYVEDKKKFSEKEKVKAEKKRQEKWKRYSHVDVGQRLDSNAEIDMEDVDFIREQQQMMYEIRSQNGLERERQKEAAKCKREEQKQKERLEKYASVSTVGHRLDIGGQTSSRADYLLDINRVLDNGHIEEQLQSITINATTSQLIENRVIENTSTTYEPIVNKPSNAEKEEMFREQMRRAREKMQQKYDEVKNNQ